MARNRHKSAANGRNPLKKAQKGPGRPYVGSTLIGVALEPQELAALDRMRVETNRPQFIRQLIAERAGLPIDQRLSRRS